MLEGLPLSVVLLFIATVVLTAWLFLDAMRSRAMNLLLVIWLAIQGLLAYKGFYTDTSGMPPRFIWATGPAALFILIIFISKKGRQFIDGLDLRSLTLLSVVRIPVEIVLCLLFLYRAIPELMTFEGRNFDILAGLTAPIIYFTCFKARQVTKHSLLLIWNILSLGLLLNIVIHAILSAPFRFQQFGFDQPNKAVLYFPFIWLPCFIVMAVLFSHLASIRNLLLHKKGSDIFVD